jgi:hypothetical protein
MPMIAVAIPTEDGDRPIPLATASSAKPPFGSIWPLESFPRYFNEVRINRWSQNRDTGLVVADWKTTRVCSGSRLGKALKFVQIIRSSQAA